MTDSLEITDITNLIRRHDMNSNDNEYLYKTEKGNTNCE